MKIPFFPPAACEVAALGRPCARVLKIIPLLSAASFGLLATSGQAATLTVTSTADSGPGSLRQTIAAAAAGDTVQFSVSGTIALNSGELEINKKLTLLGPGPKQLTVSGRGRGRVFMTSDIVTISGLAIVNGKNGGENAVGGGVYNTFDGELTLDNCLITKNAATYGGGVLNDGILTIKNSRLQDNTSSEQGGAVYNSGTLTVDDSTLAQNKAGNGAGISNEVFVFSPSEGLPPVGTTAQVTINRSQITNNQCTLIPQSGVSGAGGISNDGGTVTISDSTIDNNSSRDGGGVFSYTSQPEYIPDFTLNNSTISGNSGRLGGGLFNAIGVMRIKSSTIAENKASNRDSAGGGITNDDTNSGKVEISSSIISGNSAYGRNRDLSGSFVSNDYNLIQSPREATFSGSTQHNILGQDAEVRPLASNGGPVPTRALPLSSPAIDQGNSLNLARDQRGFARPLDNPSIPNAEGGDGSDIGAIEVAVAEPQRGTSLVVTILEDKNDGSCSVSDCSLREAIAVSNASPRFNTISFLPQLHGTIRLQRGQLTITDPVTITGPTDNGIKLSANNLSRVLQNTATGVSLLHLTLSGGRADNGGGILNSGGLRLFGCIVLNNTATNSGGAIYQSGGTLTVEETLFSHNGSQNGGGLFCLGSVNIRRSTFADNKSNALGGGIYNRGSLFLSNSTLSSNRAQGSAALYNLAGSVQVLNSTISLNNSTGDVPSGSVTNERGTISVGSSIIAANGGSSAGRATSADVAGSFSSRGFNLIGASDGSKGFPEQSDLVGKARSPLSPKLGALLDNGGPTPTHALLSGSPALDAGKRLGVTTDQRGVLRSLNLTAVADRNLSDGSDIGAFELDAVQTTRNLVVNTTDDHDDGACTLSDCTLREALNASNQAQTPRSIQFHIPRTDAGFLNGAFFFYVNEILPVLSHDKTVIDGFSQTDFGGNTNVNGPEIVISGAYGGNHHGLMIRASNCVVQGLIINDFRRVGVVLAGKNSSYNTVRGCYIGTNSSGTNSRRNDGGIVLQEGAHDNLIGGSTIQARNVISGNTNFNVLIGASEADSTCHSNRVQGNFVGLNKTGDAPINAGGSDLFGIYVFSRNNLIGGAGGRLGNVVACQIAISLTGSAASGNRIQGNIVGLDFRGTKLLISTAFGVYLQNATRNLIGGKELGAGNLIGGCLKVAIGIERNPDGTADDAGSRNVIQGNFVGVDKTGTVAMPNQCNGVQIVNSSHNVVGGTDPRARNLIAASLTGVAIFDALDVSVYRSVGNVVQGNYIGTNKTGTKAIGNAENGVIVIGSSKTLVGGTQPGAGNLISGNALGGVFIDNKSIRVPEVLRATDNQVLGNLIGTDSSGTRALANGGDGIQIEGTLRTLVGGTDPHARNVISANGRTGIFVNFDNTLDNNGFGSLQAEDTQLLGNLIGTDITGTRALGNEQGGVFILQSLNTTLGGTTARSGNLISGNGSHGVVIAGVSDTNTQVLGNKIGTDGSGTKALGNALTGVLIQDTIDTLVGGSSQANAGNLISGNIENGIAVTGSETKNTLIQGNKIGTDLRGNRALSNGINGVFVVDAAGTTMGGVAPGTGNLISGNIGNGITILGPGAKNNKVLGNLIGDNSSGTGALGNDWGVLLVGGATLNTIGGTQSGAANLIVGNHGIGIAVYGDDTKGNSFRRNSIHGNIDPDNGSSIGIDLHASGEAEDVPTVTPNDAQDSDDGPNRLQNFPVLTQITSDAGSASVTRLQGSIDSTPNTTFVLEFYRNSDLDPSGNAEGKTYVDSVTVTTDASGQASFDISVSEGAVGDIYTATATNTETEDTSELSVGKAAIAQPEVGAPIKAGSSSNGA